MSREAMQSALELIEPIAHNSTDDPRGKAYEAITALRQALEQPDTCTWQQDGDSTSGMYGTSCRHYFDLNDGTPEDNKMQWCCYCGKKLAQELITEEEDE